MTTIVLALAIVQTKTVTFSHPCAHSSVVLEALGKELGVPMKPTGSVMRDYVLLRFDKVPVDEALRKMAEVLNATWTESNGVRYLGRTKQQEDAGRLALERRLEGSIADYIANDALKVTTWNGARALDLVRSSILPDGALDRDAANTATQKQGPCKEMLDEFLRTVGAKKLASLPENTHVMFRWSPGKGEEKIPAVLRTKAVAFIKNVVAFGTAMESIGVRLLGDFDLPGEIRLAGGKGLSPDRIAFQAQRRSNYLHVIMMPNGTNPSPYASVSVQSSMAPLSASQYSAPEGNYVPSDVARTVSSRVSQNWNGKGARLDDSTELGKAVVKWFEDGLLPEPIQVFLGEPVLEIAQKSGWNVVMCYPDNFSYGHEFTRRPTSSYSQVLDEMIQRIGVSIEDGWMVRRRPPDLWERRTTDSVPLARFSLNVYKEGWATIDALAAFAADCHDGTSYQFGRQFANALQLTPNAGNWFLFESDVKTLSLYNALPVAAKRQAREDWLRMPYEDLPKPIQTKLTECYVEKGFGVVRFGREPGQEWNMWTHNGNFAGEKPRTAQELSRSVFEVRVERAELLSTQEKEVGSRRYVSGLMRPQDAAQRYLESRDDPENSLDYGTLASFVGERLQMRVKLASGELLYFIFTTDSRNSETRYYPIAQLPGEIGDKLRAEVKRLGG